MFTPEIISYRCEIDAAPFAMSVFAADRLVLQTGMGTGTGITAPGAFCRGGVWHTVAGVLAEVRDADAIRLRCATTDPDVELRLTLSYLSDGLLVHWETADGRPCEWMGDCYDLASAGHWYGHGYHEPQWWPLDRGAIKNEPFLCNNVQSPIWLTSMGAGIVIPTEEKLSVALNVDHDGLFRVGMADVAVFEYMILIGDTIVDLYDRLLHVVGLPGRVPPRDVFAKPIYCT